MKKNQIILIVASMAFILALSACSLDSYDGPDATIIGKVIDATTQEPIITEQPNGFRIEYKEISWDPKASLQYFWGKADGTYKNTKIFAGEYEVRPIEGAFVTPPIQTIKVGSGGSVEVNFTVMPCLSIKNVSIEKSLSLMGDPGIKATFTLQNNVKIENITDYRVMVSPNKHTGANIFDPDLSSEAINFTDADINIPLTVELYGKGAVKFQTGRKYYVRIAARTSNGSSRYNFSPIIAISY